MSTPTMDPSPFERRLFARLGRGMRYDLDCMQALLRSLGSPERTLRVVSVAGTNGKGTVSYLLARALDEAGLCSGLFTSPHLVAFGERIRVCGQMLDVHEAERAYDRLVAVEAALPRPFTFFEGTLAMACLVFAERGVDVAVVEAGLGGRLDATNVFASSARLACVLTRVDLDHQAVLGPDVLAIAREKAGLWRTGRPAVVGPQRPEVEAILRTWAQTHSVPAHFVTPGELGASREALPATEGWPGYLRENAAVARAALRPLAAQGVAVTEAHLAAATRGFAWPGRYQRLRQRGADSIDVVLDAGHNPAGLAALAAALAEDPALAGRTVYGIVGALRDKDLSGMLAALRPALHRLVLCATGDGARGRDAAALAAAHPETPTYGEVGSALEAMLNERPPGGVVVVTGSLGLVGAAATWLSARQFFDVPLGESLARRPA